MCASVRRILIDFAFRMRYAQSEECISYLEMRGASAYISQMSRHGNNGDWANAKSLSLGKCKRRIAQCTNSQKKCQSNWSNRTVLQCIRKHWTDRAWVHRIVYQFAWWWRIVCGNTSIKVRMCRTVQIDDSIHFHLSIKIQTKRKKMNYLPIVIIPYIVFAVLILLASIQHSSPNDEIFAIEKVGQSHKLQCS